MPPRPPAAKCTAFASTRETASQPLDASYRLLLADETPSAGTPPFAAAKASPRLLLRKSAMDPHIERVAGKHAVDPALVRAVIEVESQFHAGAVPSQPLDPARDRLPPLK